jgi:nitrogen-specific signal transduction histidine kinase
MSRQESIHALFNQLAIVLGRADLLRIQSNDSTSQEAANLIRLAALRMQNLILQLSDERNEARVLPQIGPRES